MLKEEVEKSTVFFLVLVIFFAWIFIICLSVFAYAKMKKIWKFLIMIIISCLIILTNYNLIMYPQAI